MRRVRPLGERGLRDQSGHAPMLKVYCFGKVNPVARGNTRDLRVLWALEEMQMPFELVGMDHPAHDLNTDAFRRLSPFEQIPAIDDDGVVLSESAAILIYLAKKAGKLIPPDLAGEAQVVRWCFAAMNTVEMPLLNLLLIGFVTDSDEPTPYREFLVGWAKRHLANLDRWLDGREFIATDAFTVADILMAHALDEIKDPGLIEPYARVASYRRRCFARPAWKRALDSYNARVEAG
jgi:glutathione S-transferase